MLPHIFISGVPCTGKSFLGNWLEEKQNYIHIDAEKNNGSDFDKVGLHPSWDKFLATGRADEFLADADKVGRPIVLNWGMPLNFLPIISCLRDAGMGVFWLNGDRAKARAAFIERENKKPPHQRIPVEAFDYQMDQIEHHWEDIKEAFGTNTIKGLNADGAQRPPGEMWTDIKTKTRK